MSKLNIEELPQDYIESIKDYTVRIKDLETILKNSEDGILIVPRLRQGEFCFASETIDFVNVSKKTFDNINVLHNEGEDIKVISLHSIDIWLPNLIVTSVILPTVIGLLVNYVSSKIFNKKEKSNVDFKMIVKDGKKQKEISYNGDSETFIKLMEQLKEDEEHK